MRRLKKNHIHRVLAAALALSSCGVRAADLCKYIDAGSGGVSGCGNLSVSSGGSIPSQGASHEMNPASVPTQPSSYGLEAIDSLPMTYGSSPQYNFSIVKGFKQFGTGFSTENDDTFFTHSYLLAARNTPYQNSFQQIFDANDKPIRDINLETAFEIPVGKVAKIVQPSLGVLARYNVPLHQWGGGVGLNASSKFVSFGASYLDQPNEYEHEHVPMLVLMAGVGVGMLHVDYVWMNYLRGLLVAKPLSIWMVSLNWKNAIVFAGRRSSLNLAAVSTADYLYGFQYLVNKHFAVGAMVNYVPGRPSLGAQVFL